MKNVQDVAGSNANAKETKVLVSRLLLDKQTTMKSTLLKRNGTKSAPYVVGSNASAKMVLLTKSSSPRRKNGMRNAASVAGSNANAKETQAWENKFQ